MRWRLLLVLVVASLASCVRIADRRGTALTCWVHACPLEDDTLKIRYGLFMDFDRDRFYAEMFQFPYSNSHPRGGCQFLEGYSPTHVRLRYCQLCREAETSYKSQPTHSAPQIQLYRDPETG